MMKKTILFVIAITMMHVASAQVSGYTYRPGYWTLGLNAGASYQSSDVCNTFEGWGAGLTLAKSLYYRPGAPLSFDLRGRFLYSNSIGLDTKRSAGILKNSRLNGTENLNYLTANNNAGYVFSNYRTDMGELALEGVFNFNRLKERTRILLSLYGGIGIDAYVTRIDQANGLNGEYNYSNIDLTASNAAIRTELRSILDGDYETYGDGLKNNGINLGFMPAVGIELGYQLTKHFSIGIGHKVTFSGTDAIDGQLWNDNNTATGNKDLLHYTSIDFKWIIEPREDRQEPPIIEIKIPSANPYITYDNQGIVGASIKNIRSGADVIFSVNGRQTNFNYKNGELTSRFSLRPGNNEVVINASNGIGTDTEKTVIVYKETPTNPSNPTIPINPGLPNTDNSVPTAQKPDVNITSPNNTLAQVNQEAFTVKATVLNAKHNQITVYVNGRSTDNFNISNTILTSNIALQEGRNTIKIVAKNNAGTDEDEAVINYEKPRQQRPPVVTITEPDTDNSTTTDKSKTIKATVTNVTNKGDIDFIFNGSKTTDFNFNASASTLTANVNLKSGNNTVTIKARNLDGNDEKNVTIKHINEISLPKKPKVNITEPANNSTTTVANSTLKATVDNVKDKNDIKVTLNGNPVTNFAYDKFTKSVTASLTLQANANTIVVKATNSDGSDEESTKVTYTSAATKNPPLITITAPSNNATLKETAATLKATVANVTNKNDIQVLFNGVAVSTFNYNAMSKMLDCNVTLKEGVNTIIVKAKNADGSDEKSVSVSYAAPALPKPTVNITTPKKSGINIVLPKTSIVAVVTNVKDKSEIKIKVNGTDIKNFVFDTKSNKINALINLADGDNKINIEVKNAGGTATASTIIKHNVKAANPPSVNITSLSQPVSNPMQPNVSATTMICKVENVTQKSQITVTFNNQPVTDFAFDAATGIVTKEFVLQKGTSTVTVKATNKDGSDEDSASVNF